MAESGPMRRIEKLCHAQRVVLVVALGVAVLAVGSFLTSLGEPGIRFGWTGYAPLSAPSLGQPEGLRLVIWLALICLWAALSIRLLRPSGRDEEDDHHPE